MRLHYETNEDFAEAYSSYSSQRYVGRDNLLLARGRAAIIEKLEFNLPSYFSRRGSLKSLAGTCGLGKATLDALESLLALGLERTVEDMIDRVSSEDAKMALKLEEEKLLELDKEESEQ